MFSKVLVANRGAIATRIIRTLKKMGISSVALASEVDQGSLHVQMADEVILLKGTVASETYLNVPLILEEALKLKVDAIHPGYGFLSENAEFAELCATSGITFIGPSAKHMREFGLKHTARELAIQSDVPMLPGSDLLNGLEHALTEAERIGYPVMLKSTAGGGGIGMQKCHDATELSDAYAQVVRMSQNAFGQSGVFLEKFVTNARHIEIQIFGDGKGNVVSFGDRDCSLQRRNQKVVEETPVFDIDRTLVDAMERDAIRLGESVAYQSAGTVEYVYDARVGEYYFLEVNTRLQVEHGITEAVRDVDLVQWMLSVAYDQTFPEAVKPAQGHAIEVRIYAEDPVKNFQPSSGKITKWLMPENARVDTWVKTGQEVSSFYDPMLAKVIVKADDREQATKALQQALSEAEVYGFETNLRYLNSLANEPKFIEGKALYTSYLSGFTPAASTVEVLNPGTHSMIVSYPGRVGFWQVGVPPSGPMDALAHRLANRCLGNEKEASTIEMTVSGISLKFNQDTVICLTGADIKPTLDKVEIPMWNAVPVKAGQVLKSKVIKDAGQRAYLAIQGGFDVPDYMDSKTTFSLGGFGGHGGRLMRAGDVLAFYPMDETAEKQVLSEIPEALLPSYDKQYDIAVTYGPQGAPDFFTDEDIASFFSTEWEVHYNSSRTGIRLIGPKPTWARQDGGEAGLHPSNIHDNPYAIGAIDFTGDMPVILAQDGPSLGGFVCPATIIQAEQWKMGQLRPGDKVRFKAVSIDEAEHQLKDFEQQIVDLKPMTQVTFLESATEQSCILMELDDTQHEVGIRYRRSGDSNLLIEFGEMELDLALRFRAQVLYEKLKELAWPEVLDLTPGIRSLQVHYDAKQISQMTMVARIHELESSLSSGQDLVVKSRIVHLPLSWDDPSTQLAIDKYAQSVRPDAPWCPSNIEFIRRINGLDSIEEVKDIVFNANYLVMGLGDVYLGAPVATPLDPRHRLVTTKYNPARTWTPENAVGIGGAYMCIYGMEGPGGYQFVGRTIQVWNAYNQTEVFSAEKPWLLQFFDQIKYYPVSHEELNQARKDFPLGRFDIKIEETELSLSEYQAFLQSEQASIERFQTKQQTAFQEERQRWEESGQANYDTGSAQDELSNEPEAEIPDGFEAALSPITGSVWKIPVRPGDKVKEGDIIASLETMKIEIHIEAEMDGTVTEILVNEGDLIQNGQRLMVLEL